MSIVKKMTVLLCLSVTCCSNQEQSYLVQGKLTSIAQVACLFPKTVSELEELVKQTLNQATTDLEQIYGIANTRRTFDNTARMLDKIIANFTINLIIIQTLEMVSPEKAIRDSAHQGLIALNNFSVDNFSQNTKLYQAFKAYKDQADLSKLTAEESYTLDESMKEFERSGLHLDDKKLQKIRVLKKDIALRELNFETNIAQDNRTLTFTQDELAGLGQWLEGQERTEDGLYKLPVNQPTYLRVSQNGSVESTRKAFWAAFCNRAYPANYQELLDLIALRDELASTIGYESFAALSIAGDMAHEVTKVEVFLDSLVNRIQQKVKQEVAMFLSSLPTSVTLLPDRKFKPWDLPYVINQYKKNYLSVDETLIAEYFPLEHTLKALFDIYQSFFGITFKQENPQNLWHEEVTALSVYKNNLFLGYVLLDLFPRDNKYPHAAEITIMPTFKPTTKDFYPALVLVIANFPKATADKPSLLLRSDVTTFFHEFGHAIHAILGATELASNAGARVKRDFVEMPSQMLEEWMWQPKVLKKISQHYKTKEPLTDELIEKIVALKHYDSGSRTESQIFYSFVSLDLFKKGENKNIDELVKNLYRKLIKDVLFAPENHFYASFGHLTNYGAEYYSYLWSKVYALDLWDTIKKANFSPAIAQRYVDTILSKGGSADPMELLRNFLGREPNAQAFFDDLGI